MMRSEREIKMLVRLEKYTTEYMSLEREKELYYLKHTRDISRTAIVTLYLMQEHIDTLIKQICTLVGRLDRNGIDYDNEVATYVYNTYAPSMKRGLSDLL